MKRELRTVERFADIGRVESPAICAFPGVLDDISMAGCRVHFPVPLTVNMDGDYTLDIKFAQGPLPTLVRMLCQPRWMRRVGTQTEMGFRFLRSPGTASLKAYMGRLQSKASGGQEAYVSRVSFVR